MVASVDWIFEPIKAATEAYWQDPTANWLVALILAVAGVAFIAKAYSIDGNMASVLILLGLMAIVAALSLNMVVAALVGIAALALSLIVAHRRRRLS